MSLDLELKVNAPVGPQHFYQVRLLFSSSKVHNVSADLAMPHDLRG